MIGRQSWSSMPPVVKNLLIINGLLFLASVTFESSLGISLTDMLGLHYFEGSKFRPYQFVTYMFMHGSLSHIFFNMFAVWMFGTMIEQAWGSKKFLIYYLLTGFGAAFLHYLFIYIEISPVLSQLELLIDSPSVANVTDFAASQMGQDALSSITIEGKMLFENLKNNLVLNPENGEAARRMSDFFLQLSDVIKDGPNVVGASGSLFGILLAFGMMFPNLPLIMLFFPVPIKAKYMVIGYGAFELFSAFQDNPGDNVAHIAHLGGMLFGFIIIKFWQKTGQQWR